MSSVSRARRRRTDPSIGPVDVSGSVRTGIFLATAGSVFPALCLCVFLDFARWRALGRGMHTVPRVMCLAGIRVVMSGLNSVACVGWSAPAASTLALPRMGVFAAPRRVPVCRERIWSHATPPLTLAAQTALHRRGRLHGVMLHAPFRVSAAGGAGCPSAAGALRPCVAQGPTRRPARSCRMPCACRARRSRGMWRRLCGLSDAAMRVLAGSSGTTVHAFSAPPLHASEGPCGRRARRRATRAVSDAGVCSRKAGLCGTARARPTAAVTAVLRVAT